MGLMVECPGMIPDKKKNDLEKRCRERNPYGGKTCRNCGRSLKRGGDLVYWIEWREHGKRKRERIGPSKEAAELRLAEIRKAIVEERHIDEIRLPVSHSGNLSAGTTNFRKCRLRKAGNGIFNCWIPSPAFLEKRP